MKRTAIKRKTPLRRVSKRKQSLDAKYWKLRREFLLKHPVCQHRKKCRGRPSEFISHMKGRGRYYLDTTTWRASCTYCESWITLNGRQARAEGMAMDRIGSNVEADKNAGKKD